VNEFTLKPLIDFYLNLHIIQPVRLATLMGDALNENAGIRAGDCFLELSVAVALWKIFLKEPFAIKCCYGDSNPSRERERLA
jgi:hypothetical protein